MAGVRMYIRDKEFKTSGHTYVCGILNVTPDSFSDGGMHNTVDAALKHAEKMVAEGVDLIDVGGESTRRGYERISDEEEINRIAPVIEKIRSNFDTPISVDTYKSKVARSAAAAGADLINDIWGLKADQKMAEVITEYNLACCLMHNRDSQIYSPVSAALLLSNGMEEGISDLIARIIMEMRESYDMALAAGIRKEKIIMDPGIGFAKDYSQNVEALQKLDVIVDAFKKEQVPMLLGASRKSVIGLTLQNKANERMVGTLATTARAVESGCLFVRVHDVRENVEFIRMLETIR